MGYIVYPKKIEPSSRSVKEPFSLHNLRFSNVHFHAFTFTQHKYLFTMHRLSTQNAIAPLSQKALPFLCHTQTYATPKTPKRSSYEYAIADTGDTGSRNEASFIDYKPYTPNFFDFKGRMGMVSFNNVFTMPVFDCVILFGSCFVISFFLWEMYCRRKYDFIDIPRPADAEATAEDVE